MKPTFSIGSGFKPPPIHQQFRDSRNASNIYPEDLSNTLTDNEDEDDYDSNQQTNWKSRPTIWSDDTRMNALFAPFRKRDLNPLHYDNKMKFWRELITAYCKEKQILQVDIHSLEGFFSRKKIKPKCLEPVLNELIKEGSFKTQSEILKPRPGILQNVINKCIWSPLVWSTSYILNKTAISSYIPYRSSSTPNLTDLNSSTLSQKNESNCAESTLVYVNMIDTKSTELLNILRTNVIFNNVDCLIEYERLFEFGRKILPEDDVQMEKDLDLLVKYLEVNQKILVFEDDDNKKLVKFALGSANVLPATEVELSYLQLKETERKLESETQRLETDVSSLNETIKSYLQQNNRQAAMKYLKKRKQLEKSLETKDNTLSNIQAMLMSIQQADSNKMTYNAYNKSANALKEATKDVNMDKLDDTMQDLKEVMEINADIEDVLRSPISNRQALDDTELNQELAELLASDTPSKRKQDETMDMSEMLSNLPQVPKDPLTPKAPKISTPEQLEPWKY